MLCQRIERKKKMRFDHAFDEISAYLAEKTDEEYLKEMNQKEKENEKNSEDR